MKPENVTERLHSVRELLYQLGEGVIELANSHPDVFDDTQLKSELEAFQKAYQEAKVRLEHPKLSIATLGTTSSGKSTIVNALIGRRIAPIERSEMSGGILKLGDSDTVQLVIENTQNAEWETGEWTGLTDAELYNRIQQVMGSYHETRKQRTDCLAPQISVHSQLLPVRDRELLNLPEGIDLEIIDLPGLKSVQDRANLQVIQEQVKESCSLVALDYGQVDEEHRERLLQELKEVVESLNGRTDSMIFVLNRVDMRGADDFPLDQQIERLKGEIQEILSLETPPDVIPFSARLLYYAQCAWGTTGANFASNIDQETRLKLLQAMFKDCASIIRQSTAGDKNLRRWFRDIEDDVEDGELINDETMRKILRYALEWSGGQQFWDTLRYRVQESFSQLVMAPVLNPVFQKFNRLQEKISLQSNQSTQKKKEEVRQRAEDLIQQRQALEKETTKIPKKMQREVDSIVKSLEKNTPSSQEYAIKKAKVIGMKNFEYLRKIVDEVIDDLNFNLITPIEEALEQHQPAFELRDILKDSIPLVYAEEIARAFEIIKEVSQTFTHNKESQHFCKRVRVNNEEEMKRLDQIEAAYNKLSISLSYAIVQRAELKLQAQCNSIEESVQTFAETQKTHIQNQIADVFPELAEAIEAEFADIIQSNLPKLPKQLFDLSSPVQQNTTKKSEKVGTTTEKQNYTVRILFLFKINRTRFVEKDIYDEFEYRELQVPDFPAISDQWREGIETAKSELWHIIATWIKDYIQQIDNEFHDATNRVIELMHNSIKIRLEKKEQEFKKFKQNCLELDSKKNKLVQYNKKLQEYINV